MTEVLSIGPASSSPTRSRRPGPRTRATIGLLFFLLLLVPQTWWAVQTVRGESFLGPVQLALYAVMITLALITVRSPFTGWHRRPGRLFLTSLAPCLLLTAAVLFLLWLGAAFNGMSSEDLDWGLCWVAYGAICAATPGLASWVASGRGRWLATAGASWGITFAGGSLFLSWLIDG